MEKRTKMVPVDVYVAFDGTEHKTQEACEAYENEKKEERMAQEIERMQIHPKDADWPSMLPLNDGHEYRWYRINNDRDLNIFCHYASYYHPDFKKPDIVKEELRYPDCICLVQYPNREQETRWYALSRLIRQFVAFTNALSDEVLRYCCADPFTEKIFDDPNWKRFTVYSISTLKGKRMIQFHYSVFRLKESYGMINYIEKGISHLYPFEKYLADRRDYQFLNQFLLSDHSESAYVVKNPKSLNLAFTTLNGGIGYYMKLSDLTLDIPDGFYVSVE